MKRNIRTATVFGATGYTGTAIVEELLDRGVSVTGVARTAGSHRADGREQWKLALGDIADLDFWRQVTEGRDAVILAVPPWIEQGHEVAALVPQLLADASERSYRLGIVGGAGTLQVVQGGPQLMTGEEFPVAARPTAEAHGRLLESLRASDSDAEWFYLSPAARYGVRFPGRKTGSYRLGGDVLVSDAAGQSTISAEDYAAAFVDELCNGQHLRTRFSVGY